MVSPSRPPLVDLALLVLKLGSIGFGGPAAHVAMMEDEVVRRRGWLSREAFLDLVGATNLIPGPNSTELAIHIGRLRAGRAGLVVAGAAFILPAFLIVMACAWFYVRFGSLPGAEGLLYGVKPVVIAVVLQALLGLGRTALRTRETVAAGLAALAASAAGVHELVVLLVAGLALVALRWVLHPRAGGTASVLLAAPLAALAGPPAGGATAFGLWPLVRVVLKGGSVLLGSGDVLLAFLRADLVERWGWLSEAQLLDAVAIGQVTPGPVFTTATFVGYLLGGEAGAVAATVGIFLPAFVFVALSGPLVPFLRRSPRAAAFLDGVNAASLALMAVVAAQLASAAVVDLVTLSLSIASAVLLVCFRVSSSWLVLGGALAGLALRG